MESLRIYVDLGMPDDVLALLREGTQGHELVFPSRPIASVLAQGVEDPQFASIDVAFGQPDLNAIAHAVRLRWIHISSSGITRYDTPEFRAQMKKRGIPLTNSAGAYDEACSVHLLSFLLAQARNLPVALRTRALLGSSEWNVLRDTSSMMRGETVLILGFGAIGKRVVELLRPLRMHVIGYRRSLRGDEGIPMITTPEELLEKLGVVDHVVNILPESGETQGFFDAVRFARMRPGAVFYNIGRGKTVNQEALAEALRSGQVGAAWLDVTEPEPLPNDHPLWNEPNCHITPHIAGGHPNETKTLVLHFLQNLHRFVRGEPLIDRVM